MTEKEKAELIRFFVEGYYESTGEYLKFDKCSRWEYLATFTDKAEYWKIVRTICDMTGWSKKDIFTKGRNEERIFRRALIDFLAVKNGCSYNQCARLTKRDHTTVLHSVTKFENRLETETHTRLFFSEVVKYLRENYPIYHGKVINENLDTV